MKTGSFDCFPKLRRVFQDGGIQVVSSEMENTIQKGVYADWHTSIYDIEPGTALWGLLVAFSQKKKKKRKKKVSWSVPMWQVHNQTLWSSAVQKHKVNKWKHHKVATVSCFYQTWHLGLAKIHERPRSKILLWPLLINHQTRVQPSLCCPTHPPSTPWLSIEVQSSHSRRPGSKSPPDTVTCDRSDTSHPILVTNQVDLLFRQLSSHTMQL